MITVRFLYYNWFRIIPDDYTEGNKNMIQAIVLFGVPDLSEFCFRQVRKWRFCP